MKKHWLILLLLTTLMSCKQPLEDLTIFVDPMIGTDAHGHTFPGATTPFGMVQLSPDIGIEGWDWCSGYHYSDSSIMGFSHTHLSGTGGADLGDILVMPFLGDHKWEPGTKDNPDLGYRSRFSHQREFAKAGYYSVLLDDYNITAELTATPRTGIHRYTFAQSEASSLIIDLKHGIANQPREAFIRINGNNEVVGLRRSQGWAADQYVYFVARFSAPFTAHTIMVDNKIVENTNTAEGKEVKLILDFDAMDKNELMVKVAISAVDVEGAIKNMEAEAPHWNFETYKNQADDVWNEHLNKISIEGSTEAQKRTFYTALYHAQIAPNLYTDADGRYRGMDKEVHSVTPSHNMYTIFSLWDTFRATHPLFTIIEPERNTAFINTMLTQYQQHGTLPVWELMANETGTMIGYHSVPVIWDAYVKGQRDFDAELAFDAMKKSAKMDHIGLKDYKELGFIPLEREGNSVSKLVEYAYDDWCIAQMAKALGQEDDYQTFIHRSQNYRNVFDTSLGFLRGRRADGSWRTPFDPIESSILGSGDFTEGNSWHYSFFAPHDVTGLMNLMGGDAAFAAKIDEMFNQEDIVTNQNAHDISGLIGQYAQGNEPSHHVAYLYNFGGQPWKTQEKVALILDSLYTDKPDGISGNEDCGQLSAWYIFSAAGFYPVTPGSGDYIIGTPLFEQLSFNLNNGKQFTVKANGRNKEAIYIQAALLNGKPFNRSFIKHEELMAGGVLEFTMGTSPNKTWASQSENRPFTTIPEEYRLAPIEQRLVFAPYINETQTLFAQQKEIAIQCNTPGVSIHHNLNGNEVSENDPMYTGPFIISETQKVSARAFKDGLKSSELLSREFIRAHFNKGETHPSVYYNLPPSPPYDKAGDKALIDGYRGSKDFHDGQWLGFNRNLEAMVNLGAPKKVKQVRLSFMRNVGSWILLPQTMTVYGSTDNQLFTKLGTITTTTLPQEHEGVIREFLFPVNASFQYFKISAEALPQLPDWHPGAGNRPWIFADEIIFEY